LVASWVRAASGGLDGEVAVTRLLADGLVDLSFGRKGTAYPMSLARSDPSAVELVVAPDGRIIVAGTYSGSGVGRTFQPPGTELARLTRDGKPDRTFGNRGIVTDSELVARAMAVAPDGSITVTGAGGTRESSVSSTLAVTRYLPAGSRDPRFGTAGYQTIGFGPGGS
jgi:uncharacterized delta-60 repeat protein